MAMRYINRTINLELRPNGCFSVFNVGRLLDSIIGVGRISPQIKHTPEEGNTSHASVKWENMETNDQEVAAELLVLLHENDVLKPISPQT